MSFKTRAISYGLVHEEMARNDYTIYVTNLHKNAVVSLTGLTISTEESIMAATPDAMIRCDCCGPGCVEFKCPYRMFEKKINIKQFAMIAGSCLILDKDDKFLLV